MSERSTRAVILTTQRTGSTFLAECLASHPDIHCAGELLNGQPDVPIPPPRGPFRYIVKFARIARRGAWLPAWRLERFYQRGDEPVRCFKAMYNQLARPFALDYLLRHTEIRVIHLSRHNLLKAYVSALLMQKRRPLQATGPVPPVRIRVDPRRAISALRAARARQRHFEALFSRHAQLRVTYESLFDGAGLAAVVAREICSFLGVREHPMHSAIVKMNPRSLAAIVSNYDELSRAVGRSEFAPMLLEEG